MWYRKMKKKSYIKEKIYGGEYFVTVDLTQARSPERMMRMKSRIVKTVASIICAVMLAGCGGQKVSAETESSTETESASELEDTVETEPVEQETEVSHKLTVWNAYWDLGDAAEEIERRKDDIAAVCFFAAYFNAENRVFIPEETASFFVEKKEKYEENGWVNYLTVVNDRRNGDGSSSLKDTEMLYQLFASEEQIRSHAEEVIGMAVDNGYTGIELDYENIKDDITLWNLYLDFVYEVWYQAKAAGLSMRVLLEPNTPVDELDWVDGPEYVMMCYNLYGSHSGPGPKADMEFLAGLVEKMEPLPGKKNFALATGGFDWSDDDTVSEVKEEEAHQLEDKWEAEPKRDEASGSMVFQYTDENGISHEVWYADKETISGWREAVYAAGNYDVSLWRIGGNVTEEVE